MHLKWNGFGIVQWSMTTVGVTCVCVCVCVRGLDSADVIWNVRRGKYWQVGEEHERTSILTRFLAPMMASPLGVYRAAATDEHGMQDRVTPRLSAP